MFTQIPEHGVNPVWQAHTALSQICPVAQTVAQAPQLEASERRLTHWPSQRLKPLEHAQTPLTHWCPTGQALLHWPQWLLLCMGSMQLVPHSS